MQASIFKNKNIIYLVFWVSQLVFLLLNLFTLKDGHNFASDFAQYIIHAQNILSGQPYLSNLNLDSWVVGAPGLPYILAGVMKIFGINYVVFKALNAFFWAGHCIAIFYIAKRYVRLYLAVAGSLILSSSPYIFMFKQSVLTDVPFVFFVSISLLFFIFFRENQSKKHSFATGWFLLAMASASFALLLRHAGMILFIVFFLSGKVNRDSTRNTSTPIIFLIVIKMFEAFLWHVPILGNTQELSGMTENWFSLITTSFAYNLTGILVFFFPHAINPLSESFSHNIWEILRFFAVPLLLFLMGWVILRIRHGRISVRALFFVLYFFALTFWPISDGIRYMLPLVGLIVIMAMYVLQRAGEMIKLGDGPIFILVSGFIVWNIFSIGLNFGFNDDDILQPKNQEMIEWVKNNTKPDEYFAAQHVRVIGLLTNRQGIQNWFTLKDPEYFMEKIKKYNIKYLIFSHERLASNFKEYIKPLDDFILVWRTDQYIIYELLDHSLH